MPGARTRHLLVVDRFVKPMSVKDARAITALEEL